jgi:hypothetical protein
MVLGTLGSTLNDELNRLANGGTYRDMDDMVDEALAAKQWANRENISPYSTDTVGVLNEIAGLGLDKKNWLDFNGICNYIAGTSGLPAAAALRQIYPTTDLLTGVASYYVDAATPTNWGSLGYVRLNGVTGNYLSTPDATALDITGDIDLRARVSLDDWTPAAAQMIIAKYITATNNRSYRLQVNTDGTLQITWSTAGTSGTAISKSSTVATGLTDGSVKWIRATLDVDNGASGNDVRFFLSDDGTTWTQLGTTVTTAGTTSIFSSTSILEIGASENASLMTGNFYRAQVLNGIGGTTVLDVNIATDFRASNEDIFTATTGQTVTVNGVDVIANYGSAGALLPTTLGSSTAADSNDAIFLAHTGTNYVYLPGVNSNFLSIPDGPDLDITGDIDIRAQVALDDWTPSVNNILISKWNSGGSNNRGWIFNVLTSGLLNLQLSADGTNQSAANSTVVTGLADGSTKWVRATYRQSDRRVQFFTSDNGTSWTQLGADVTSAQASIFSNNANINIGAFNAGLGGENLTGKIYRAQVLNGIDGTVVLDVDTSVITTGAATSFTAVTGQTVTINRSTSGRKTVAVTQPTWLFGTDDYMEVNNRYMAHSTSDENYVYLSGASGNYMSVSDNPPLDVTGDIDLRVNVAMDDWTPATDSSLLAKRLSTGNQQSYQLFVANTTGLIGLFWSTDGNAAFFVKYSTVAPTVTDGGRLWVRATLDIDNGAGGNTVKFFTSSNGTTWTQLGTDVVTSGVTSIYSGTAPVEIGSFNNGVNNRVKGAIYRAQILNGIDGPLVLDANAAVITLPSQTTFTDSSSNAYTVTINKSGVGTFVSTGNYLYLPGIASNYASAPDSAALDITGDIDLRLKLALDDWTPSALTYLFSKYQGAGNVSYAMSITTAGLLQLSWSVLGTTIITKTSTVAPTVTDGSTLWVRATLDVDNGAVGNDVKFFTSTDGLTWTQLGTTVTTAGTTSIYAGTSVLEIGSVLNGTSNAARGKFFRAQVLNGIGGTVAFDANFEGSITSLTQASFTESSSNAATVTINRSGSAFRSAGVIDAGYLYPGATNTFSNSTTNFLDMGANQDFTALAFVRVANNAASSQQILGKGNYGGSLSYVLESVNTGFNGSLVIDGGNYYYSGVVSTTIPTTLVLRRSGATVTTFANNTLLAPPAQAGDLSKSIANIIATFRIGRLAESASGYADMEFMGAAVFRQALTATQIRQVTNYFTNREVYL